MSKGKFYITTPIYYPSAKLHIGHAYCTTVADALARFHRFLDEDVFFCTGSDEHGQKIQLAAEAKNISPKAYVDEIVEGFKKLWNRFNISNDDFVRTTDERHIKVAQEMFRRAQANGDIYKGKYTGLYCTPCESYWTEHQLVDGKCPDCGREVQEFSEEAYFFKLSKYADWILDYIQTHEEFIQPVSRRNEMINFIKQGLEDLCISRTSFDWGIPVPGDEKHVLYVWFDALTNYLTPIGFLDDQEKFKKFWPCDVHLVGKEIVRFHSIIWPCMLKSAGLELPKKIYGHGWLIVDGDKMSKSKGNVIDPNLLLDEFGVDALRYFLLREITLGQDGSFSRDSLIERINADLANDLGNLLHRTLNMIEKFQAGKFLEVTEEETTPFDAQLKELAETTAQKYKDLMNQMEMSSAIKLVWGFVSRANKYIDETAPWALAKDETKKKILANVLSNLGESLRVIAGLISPFMPVTAQKIYAQLGFSQEAFENLRYDDIKSWKKFPAGQSIGKAEPLFPRIEIETETETKQTAKQKTQEVSKKKNSEQKTDEINIGDFNKVQMRVVKILSAEKVSGTDSLLKLKVDLGQEQREVVSGIAKHYKPEELIGKTVAMVMNLKPSKIRGVLSQGMILTALQGNQLKILEVDMPVGSQIR